MKAEVEPLPLVPAMWMRFKRLKSSGYRTPGSVGTVCFIVPDDEHTSYPIFRVHSTISAIACWFILLPDLRIASTTAKLDWSVLRAATASYCLSAPLNSARMCAAPTA